MNLIFTEKEIDNNYGEYIILAKNDVWKKYLTNAKSALIKKLEMPGFRKGHIPADIANKHLDSKQIMSQALNKFMDDACKFVNENNDRKVLPFNHHLVEIGINEVNDEEASIKFSFPLQPKVDVSNWDKLEITFDEIKPSTTIEKGLLNSKQTLIDQKTEHKLIEDKDYLIKKNDLVVLDFEGKIEHKVFPGGSAKKFSLIIGSGQFIPGFEEQLVGLKAGQEKDVKVSFPKDYQVNEFAGKEAIFHIFIHEIKQSSKPKFDDTFIESLNLKNIKTVDQWEKSTTNSLKDTISKEISDKKEEKLLEEFLTKMPIEISHKIIEKNFENAKNNFYNRIKEINAPKELVFIQMQKTEEEVLKQIEEDSLNQLKLSILIGEIASLLKIPINKELYDEWLKNSAEKAGMKISELEAKVPMSLETINRIRNEIAWNKIKDKYIK